MFLGVAFITCKQLYRYPSVLGFLLYSFNFIKSWALFLEQTLGSMLCNRDRLEISAIAFVNYELQTHNELRTD